MKPTKENSGESSELQYLQDNKNVVNELFKRVTENYQEKNIRLEILEHQKMSDILTEFVDPYTLDAEDDEDLIRILDLGVIAWNLSFFSRREQRKYIDDLLQDVLNKEFKEDFKSMIGQLIARKKRYFSTYKRLILDYELQYKGDDLNLFVVSQPFTNKPKKSR